MVESGPYVEYRCMVYVQEQYVIQCVLTGLLLTAALIAAHLWLRRWKKKRAMADHGSADIIVS